MLKNTETTLIQRAVTSLIKHGEAELAGQLSEVLTESSKHKERLAASAAKRSGGTAGRHPTRAFVIDVEPGGTWHCLGARATCEKIKELLTEFGSNRTVPNPNSLGVALSQRGHWHCMVDTDNGSVSISARHADLA